MSNNNNISNDRRGEKGLYLITTTLAMIGEVKRFISNNNIY